MEIMTKRYCDICGQPAIDFQASERVPFGEIDESFPALGPHIVVRASFSFEGRKDKFGGPPDLCQTCGNDLIRKLLKA